MGAGKRVKHLSNTGVYWPHLLPQVPNQQKHCLAGKPQQRGEACDIRVRGHASRGPQPLLPAV